MWCPRCGKEVEEEALFCWFCGLKQKHAEPKQEETLSKVEEVVENAEEIPSIPEKTEEVRAAEEESVKPAEHMPANTETELEDTVEAAKKQSHQPLHSGKKKKKNKKNKPVPPPEKESEEQETVPSVPVEPTEDRKTVLRERIQKSEVVEKLKCALPQFTTSTVLILTVAILGVFAFFGVLFSFCSGEKEKVPADPMVQMAEVEDTDAQPAEEPSEEKPEEVEEPEDPTLQETEDGQTRYVNARYGYSITIPSEFTADKEADNGDGRRFMLSDYEMSVKVYGGNEPMVEEGMGLRDFYQKTIDNLPVKATYTHLGSKNYVVSWKYEDTIYYQKTYVGDETSSTVLFEYPADNKNVCDGYLEKIVASFKG